MSGIRNLAGDTVWYGLSSIIGKFISYFLIPLHTFVFVPEEYGVVTEFYAYIYLFFLLYLYGMETAYFRFATKEGNSESEYFNLALTTLMITSSVFSTLLYVSSDYLAEFLGYPGKGILVQWLAIILAFDTIVILPFARLRLQKKAFKFAMVRIGNILVSVALNLFFYWYCLNVLNDGWTPWAKEWVEGFYDIDFKVKYVLLANVIASGSFIIFLIPQFKGFRLTIQWKKIKPLLIYAMPLLIMSLAHGANEMLSRALLEDWLPEGFYPDKSSLAALGIFGACYKLSAFMVLGIQAFRYAAEPFFFSKAGKKDSPELFAKIMTGFVAFNCVVLLSISANLEWMSPYLLTKEVYREGLYIVPILLLAYLFYGIYYNLSVWFKVTDKTRFGAYITITGAILTIVLNWLLVPLLGYLGSSLVTLIVFVTMSVISFTLGRRHYPVPYEWAKVLKFVALSSFCTTLAFNLDLGDDWFNFLIRNGIVLAFIAYLYLSERQGLKGIKVFGFTLP